jgi:hypothetical protein
VVSSTDHVLELLRDALVLILVSKATQQAGLVEHLTAALKIEIADLGDAHPQSDARRDDRSGAGPRDVIELVG